MSNPCNGPGWRSKKKKRYEANLFERFWGEQAGLCCYCRAPMIRPDGTRDEKTATWEHIHPRSMGGSNAVANLALACRECNEGRGKSLSRQLLKIRNNPGDTHASMASPPRSSVG